MAGPTAEQDYAVELARKGDSMVVEAGAGTGKTTTLRLLAFDAHRRGLHGRYLAFNKPIVNDVKGKLPRSCTPSTAHSLAYGAVGKHYAARLQSGRMRGEDIADRLGLDPFTVRYGKQTKRLAPGWLAGVVMRGVGRFCQSADDAPERRHVPYIDGLDIPDDQGHRTYAVNNELATFLLPSLEVAWADLRARSGYLPFKHEHYLKLWQLSHPRIPVDYLLFDEAQDANPVMAAVVDEQTHAQRVYVGDANQAIYEWTGAVNAIETMKQGGLEVARLTESFRFGMVIADAANEVLTLLRSDLELRGQRSLPSSRGALEAELGAGDAILCRTNAGAMVEVLEAVRRGQPAHLVGGGAEVLAFARAAGKMQAGEQVWHPDLACFTTWGEVKEYVANDQLGNELAMFVKLIEEFTVPTILGALDSMPQEDPSILTVSTAHKSKGREWDRVKVGDDFAPRESDDPPDHSTSELRLRYVAFTRPRLHLDDSVFDQPGEAQ